VLRGVYIGTADGGFKPRRKNKSRDGEVAARGVIGSTETCLKLGIHKGSDEATPPRPLLVRQ